MLTYSVYSKSWFWEKREDCSMQYIFIWNKFAYLPNSFALLFRRFFVDILCLNCDYNSSYVNMTSCRICFTNFLVSSRNKLNCCLFNTLVEIFLIARITNIVIAFVKVSKEDLLGEFSMNRTSECKTGFSLLYFTYCFQLTLIYFYNWLSIKLSISRKSLKCLLHKVVGSINSTRLYVLIELGYLQCENVVHTLNA